jgi:hypothetical protein
MSWQCPSSSSTIRGQTTNPNRTWSPILLDEFDLTGLQSRTVFFFTLTRRLIFCLITVIVSLAVHDGAFAAPSLTSIRRVFQVKNRGPVKCTPLRWKKEWLKRPVFRRFDDSIISASASAGVAEHTRSGASGSQDTHSEDGPPPYELPPDESPPDEPPPYEPLPYHKLRDDMARQSLDYGCEKPIEPKAWRRGAANTANGRLFYALTSTYSNRQ